eukprot:1393743-Amorphochlora_amoeboformis.AAC.3
MGSTGSAIRTAIGDAKRSKKLQLGGKGLSSIPKKAFDIKGLKEVWLQDNDIHDLPFDLMEKWDHIDLFYVNANPKVAKIPTSVKAWKHLEEVTHIYVISVSYTHLRAHETD